MTIDASVEKLTRRTLHTLFSWKWFIAFMFVLTCVVMLLLTILVTPTYRAANRVLVSHNYKQQLSLFDEVTSPGQLNTRVNYNNNFLNVLRSEVIAEQIVEEFGLAERLQAQKESPETFRERIKMSIVGFLRMPIVFAIDQNWLKEKPKDWKGKAVDNFIQEALDSKIVENTEILEIGVYQESPELANAIADRLTELLVEQLLELNRSEAGLAYTHAVKKADGAKAAYDRAISALEKMKREFRVASFSDEKRLLVEHKESLEIQANANEVRLADLKGQLRESEQLTEDERLLPERHNEIISSMSQLQIELAGVLERGFTIEENLQELVVKIDEIILKENAYTSLSNDVNLAQRIYLQLREKVEELSIQQEANTGEFGIDVIDRQHVSEHANPDSPDMVLFFPMILFFAAAVSLGIPFLIEYFRNYPLDEAEIAELTGADSVVIISSDKTLKRLL